MAILDIVLIHPSVILNIAVAPSHTNMKQLKQCETDETAHVENQPLSLCL